MTTCFQWLAAFIMILSLSACSALVRKVPVQQGNIIQQHQVDQLKPGMSMQEVKQIMGDPVLNSTFNPNRLDYVYTYRKGKAHKYQRVSLTFKDNRLQDISGTMVPNQNYR